MLEAYWPSTEEIKRCIRTEAEELSEAVLLAVHEPIQLIKRRPGESEGEAVTEADLLQHFLEVERPIPIIGESGIGKSHLIRWLDSRLRVHPDTENWLIRRIPKNAGLRGVLELLLEGLEGAEFEQVRARIDSVGDELNERNVADHLIVAMGHQLEKLGDEARQRMQGYKETGQRPSPEEEQRLRLWMRQAARNKLPTLINDPLFNSFLKDPDRGCIYRIAKRLTGNSSLTEVSQHNYRIEERDLKFDINPGDLSVEARNYFAHTQLNTSVESQREVKELLNEVINDACRETFYQFFHFNSGSFQELFTSIRKNLLAQGKTLVLLIEDMAAISAIEDVLIDSLMTESVRDGVEVLCPLRSAIAVTEGYIGYQKRRNTLATRALYEWYLPNRAEDEAATLRRIENFCGRYLNAARIGEAELRATYPANDPEDFSWPGIWRAEEEDDALADFGKTDEGVPLFPYNHNAIQALANNYCVVNEELVFNPRTVLHHILRNLLLHYRPDFEKKQFPPPRLGGIECPGQLAAALRERHLEDIERVKSLAAIWGWGARDLGQLANTFPATVANAFHLDAFAQLLDETRRHSTTPETDRTPKPEHSKIQVQPTSVPEPKPKPDPDAEDIASEVDRWFSNKDVPQEAAKLIRAALLEELKAYGSSAVRWWGVMKLPELVSRNVPKIYVAYNTNNPVNVVAKFGSEKAFKDEASRDRYKAVITAILRRAHYGDWPDYTEGYEDYCRYRAFLSEWLPEQVSAMLDRERDKAKEAFCKHLSAALLLEPRLENLSHVDRLAVMCRSVQAVQKSTQPTGMEEWDSLIQRRLDEWEANRNRWLPWFTTRKGRGIEGDLLKSRKCTVKMPLELKRKADRIAANLQRRYGVLIELLQGCSSKSEFHEAFEVLSQLIKRMRSEDQYKDMEGYLTSQQFLNRVGKLLKDEELWPTVKALLNLDKEEHKVVHLNAVRTEVLDAVDEVLEHWQLVYQRNYSRIKAENQEAGADTRGEKQQELAQLLRGFALQLDIPVVDENHD